MEPDQSSGGTTIPSVSPGYSIPVGRPKPNFSIHSASFVRPSPSARVIVPTFEEREMISDTVNSSVPRGTASLITRSATSIVSGSV